MEDKAVYKDEHLEETKKIIQQILDERGCGLVVVGDFVGDKIRTFVKIQRLKKDETSINS